MNVMNHVLKGMITLDSMSQIRQSIPTHLKVKTIKIKSKVLNDKLGRKIAKGTQSEITIKDYLGNTGLIGAWGYLCVNGEKTDIEGRILNDGTFDLLEVSGRHVMIEGLKGRSYPNLRKIEELLMNLSCVSSAHAYVSYSDNNKLWITADIETDKTYKEETLREYIHHNCEEYLTTDKFIINNEQI